jgi:hypothetical protein
VAMLQQIEKISDSILHDRGNGVQKCPERCQQCATAFPPVQSMTGVKMCIHSLGIEL